MYEYLIMQSSHGYGQISFVKKNDAETRSIWEDRGKVVIGECSCTLDAHQLLAGCSYRERLDNRRLSKFLMAVECGLAVLYGNKKALVQIKKRNMEFSSQDKLVTTGSSLNLTFNKIRNIDDFDSEKN